MEKFSLPTRDKDTVLMSHGETITYTRVRSVQEEYAWRSSRGTGNTGLSREQVKDQLQTLAEAAGEFQQVK